MRSFTFLAELSIIHCLIKDIKYTVLYLLIFGIEIPADKKKKKKHIITEAAVLLL